MKNKPFIKESKLNIKRIVLVLLILFIVIFILKMVIENHKLSEMKKADVQYSAELALKQQKKNEEMQNQIKEAEEKKQRKYAYLNNEELTKISNIYRHSDVKRVFLTFDDGPTKQVTPYILNLLKSENIKANFFVIGTKVEQNPELVKIEYEEGHFIGNHGYSHKYSTIYSSVDSVLEEYNKNNNLIKKAIGNENYNSFIFRFPGGLVGGPYNDLKHEALQKLNENGIGNVDWNALTNDADGAKTKEAIMENFYKTVKDKTSVVLLMHDAADKILTYETLPEIIKYFKENGYQFQTMFDAVGR